MAKEIMRHGVGRAVTKSEDVGKKVLAKGPGVKHSAKKAAKKAAKHAAKKGSAKHAAKRPGRHETEGGELLELTTGGRERSRDELMAASFRHLNRASAVISLLEQETGGDLRLLLDKGISRYKKALEKNGRRSAEIAYGLLCAAEHLGMAGLFAARRELLAEVAAVEDTRAAEVLRGLPARLEALNEEDGSEPGRLLAMSAELTRRAEAAVDHDPHLAYELTMAAHWICSAMERKAE